MDLNDLICLILSLVVTGCWSVTVFHQLRRLMQAEHYLLAAAYGGIPPTVVSVVMCYAVTGGVR